MLETENGSIRRKPRQLTKFLCSEMLYDYMTGHLDAERKKAVEDFIVANPEMQTELQEMTEAMGYCRKLSDTKLSDELVSSLAQVRLVTEVMAEKVAYRNWPDILKWSTEATIISVCVAGIAMVVPWGSLRTVFERPPAEQITLADVDKKINEKDVKAPPAPSPTPTPEAEEAAPVAVASPPAKPAPKIIAKTDEVKPNPNDKRGQPKGLLYRIMMTDAQAKSNAPAIRDHILSLGGKKAGQVEIGWRKSNGNYYHFSMPEKEYQTLISTLGGYGPVRIYKSPHERVMPQGTIRIILWIEDAPGSSADSEVPADSSEITAPATEESTEANGSEDPTSP